MCKKDVCKFLPYLEENENLLALLIDDDEEEENIK
jgi:hypothetical protein